MSKQTNSIVVWIVIAMFSAGLARCHAQAPLSNNVIKRLVASGDRLATQGDYQGALEKYTEAYLGVVSKIRGQAFKEAIKPSTFTREELGKEMLTMFNEEFTDAEIQLMEESYRVFGFAPADLDLRALMTQLYTEEVAGFYDPDKKRMVLILEDGPQEEPGWLGRLLGAKPAFDKDEQKTTLAHELTHALQDQLYDLNAMEKGIESDDDQLLAFQALVEGDATLLMFVEMGDQDVSDMDPEAMKATFNLMSWMLPLSGGSAFRKAPPIFRESLTFPYFQGMIFVLSTAAKGGWENVHDSYRVPPLSTEQILHPQKYINEDERDNPQRVMLPELASALDESWTHLGGNCLGEFQLRVLLRSARGGSSAAAGWDGDRYEVFRSKTGKLGVVSVSIWDSNEDAAEFAEVYKKYRESQSNSNTVFDANCDHAIEQHESQVWAIEGFSTGEVSAIGELLKTTTFVEKTFPLPSSGTPER